MKIQSVLPIVALSFALALGCSSKKKDGEGTDIGGEPGAAISNQDISFDPKGSDSGNISGLSTVFFAYDRASLGASTKAALRSNADWMKANTNAVLQIEGHCDTRGSVEYNLALGERRAQAVKNYLVSLGVDSKNLTVISYGEEKPLSLGDAESDHTRNRRANFVPLPK